MGANAKTIQVTLKTVADIKDVTSNVAQLQKALSGLSLSKGLEGQFTKLFTNVERNAEKASTVFAAGFKSKGDVNAYEKATNLIVEDMKKISQLMGQIDTSKLNFQIDTSKSKTLTEDIARLKQEIDAIRTQNLTELQKLVNNKPSGANAWNDFFTAFQRGDEGIEDAEKALKRLQTQVDNAEAAKKDFSEGSQWYKYQQGVNVCAKALQILKGETGEAAVKQAELNQKTQELNTLQQQANNSGAAWLQGLLTNLTKVNSEAETYIRNTQKSAASTQQLGSELDQFKSRIAYFFGLNNAIALFQRALRSAYSTVKDLDAVMTEMAVVTDFDLGDIWNQLPEYTARANELGVAISDAYESMTIFYQQGLKTDSALALSNETLKMARIAGLDAAEATDRMTNALRGFNMELNETNAQRVDDVYNKLAAISASNVDEISTAMTKVAPLANNANMEFETTSAFLAQIIETTRESAETAGSALKTVIARFSEVKELFSEGELLGTDSEGEAIDVNKVSIALRTAGINLNEYLTGMKGLDDIFIELAQKWNSLDIVQQRYIATMAAGSRQQSRFIAMMSDYNRTMELVSAANNSAGAANEMFEKTLDSLETKVNKLKNAWNEFVMAIADNNLIKGAVDALTGLLNLINKLTGNSGIAKIGVTFAGLKLGKSLFNKLLSDVGSTFMSKGDEAGKGFSSGFNKGVSKFFSKKYWQDLATMPKIDTSNLNALQVAQDNAAKAAQKLTSARATLINLEQSGSATAEQLAAAQGAVTAAEQANVAAQATAISTQEAFNTMQKLGLTQEEQAAVLRVAATDATIAEALANGTLTAEQAKQIAAQEISNKARQKGLLSIIATTIAEAAHGKTLGASTIGQMLFANSTIAATLAQWGLNDALSACPLGWFLFLIGAIVAILGVLIFLIVKLVKHIQNSTPEAKLEAAKEAADDAAEAAQNAADAFTNLSDSWDSLSDKYKALEDMTRGSQEWRDAVREINAEVLDLMDKYKELDIRMIDGVLHITNIKDVLTKYDETSTKASSASIAAKQTEIEAQNDVDREDARSNFVKDTGGSYSLFDSNDDAFDAFAIALSKGEILPDDKGNYVADAEEWTRKYEEEHNLAKGSLGQFTDALNDTISGLAKFGDGLRQADAQIEDYYTALSANAISMAKVDEDKADYAATFMSGERMEKIVSQEEEEIGDISSGKERDKLREEFAQGKGYDDYAAYKKDHDDEDISDEQLKAQVAAMRAQDTATEKIKIFANNIGELSPELKKIYEKSEGQALNRNDITDLTGAENYEDLVGKNTEQIQKAYSEKIQEAWDKMDPEMQDAYGSFKEFAQEYADAVLLASESYATAAKDLQLVGLDLNKEVFNNLSSGALKSLSDNLLSIFNVSGEEGFNEIKDAFVELTKNMTSEETEKFANALNSIDWSSADSIDTLSEVVEDLGLDTTGITGDLEVFEKKLIKCANAIQNIDLDKLTEQVHSLSSIASNINKGTQERSFSEGDYKNLIESGTLEASDFAYNIETGKYDYLGDSTDRIVSAIQEQTGKLLGADQLEKHIVSGEAFNTVSKNQLVDKTDKDSLYKFLMTYFGVAGKNATIDKDVAQIYYDKGNTEKLLELYNIILNDAENLSQNKTQLDTARTQGKIAQAQLNNTAYNAHQINGPDGDIYSGALTAQATAAGMPTEELNAYVEKLRSIDEAKRKLAAEQLASMTNSYNEATALKIDTEQLQAYADTLQTANTELTDAQALAVALANTKLNAGWSEIIDTYDDWTALIDETTGTIKATTSDDVATFDKLKASVQKMLDVSEELPDSFWEDAQTMDLIRQAAEGSTDAIEQLRMLAAEKIVVGLELNENDEINLLNTIYNLNSEVPNLEVGAYLDDTQFGLALIKIMNDLNMSTEEMQKVLNSLGWEPEITYKEMPLHEFASQTQYTHGEVVMPDGSTRPVTLENYANFEDDQMVRVPVINASGTTYKGSAPSTGSTKNKNKGASNRPSGGGGGSSEKPSYWENPYDELYNLQEKINESLRTREALERRYQKLLDKTTSSLSEIRKAYYDQIKQLRAEADLQQAMAKGRKRQLNNIANETYTDSEGVQRSFASMGVTKYASYNASTGVITIDWAGLEAISRDAKREEEGKAAEAYINRLQELVEGYEEIRDELWEIEDKIEELRDEVVESYLDFEDRVMEAVVNEYQKQIDAFQAMSDEISNTTSKVLDSIKEEIDLTRQIRDNTKTEEEISDMENRLAYLRRDTSGANDLEIMQLEKDLEDARQNYTDTLIDQALDQMQKDADLAAEQRAQQQETLQNQLDIMKENGSLWDQVYTLIRNAEGSDGSFSKNSELVKLLKSNEGFNNLSNIGKAKWWEEASAAYKAAMVGKNEAEDKYGVDADNNGAIAKTGTQKAMNNVSNKSASVTPASKSSTKSARTNKEKYGVALAVLNGGYGWGSGATRKKNLEAKGFNYNEIQGIINKLVAEGKINSGAWVGAYYGIRNLSPYAMSKFKSGGLADFTGPAWLDGTKSHPELVLDATDSQNFITLKNILAQLLNGQGAGVIGSGGGDNYFDIDISAELGSDYDVDQLAERIKKQIYDNGTYRNVNTMNYLR